MFTISIYFKIKHSELFTASKAETNSELRCNGDGYVMINLDCNSDFSNIDTRKWIAKQRKVMAVTCKVPEENVILISRDEYEEETFGEYDDSNDITISCKNEELCGRQRMLNEGKISRQEFKERIDAEYNKLEKELMNDEITPDEHVERYNALLELEPQPFGPPELHEHI